MEHRPVRPDFDVNEEYLIALYRKDAGKKPIDAISADLMFLLVAIAVFVFGIRDEDYGWCLAGFGLLAYRLIAWILSTYRYQHLSTNLIVKFDNAFRSPSEAETKHG